MARVIIPKVLRLYPYTPEACTEPSDVPAIEKGARDKSLVACHVLWGQGRPGWAAVGGCEEVVEAPGLQSSPQGYKQPPWLSWA